MSESFKKRGAGAVCAGLLLSTLIMGCAKSSSDVHALGESLQGESLLDTELSHWDQYISFKIPDTYAGDEILDEHGVPVAPIGLNPKDNKGVFSVIEEEGEPVLRVSGEYYGAVITKASFDNYHLRLQVKWGDKKWEPRTEKLLDTGILYHSVGAYGAEYFRSWMMSQEFQIMEGHMGDYWNQATSGIQIKAYPREYIMSPIADARAEWLDAGGREGEEKYVMRSANYESPMGEWTTLDLICFEGQSLHIVNGEVVMALRNSHYIDKTGQEIPMQAGRIQLQSEAAEVFYRDISIAPLEEMPGEYMEYFE
ncbi:3-keto-disaccharide hydrolase [Hirschia litorea]|uniref:DUF1080 domain-containing protein n=1 Tax=Hirschia litorea TaxID=1199156 RepID=A0ABW2ILR2_9PROT